MCEPVVETFTGKMVDLRDPQPEQICVEDIAHALSLICRFNGNCSEFYSVAEHACNVVEAFLNDPTAEKYTKDSARLLALALLCHDAAESYVGDQVRSLLALPEFSEGFMPVYRRIEAAINKALDLPEMPEGFLAKYDDGVLHYEAQALMRSRGEGWELDHGDIEPPRLDCMPPEEAEETFLRAFEMLSTFLPDSKEAAHAWQLETRIAEQITAGASNFLHV